MANHVSAAKRAVISEKKRLVNKSKLTRTKTAVKKAETAIVQGGMGVGISLSGLASAVAKEGGIGVIAANAIGMIESDYFSNHIEANVRALRSEISKARNIGNGIIVA